MIKGFLPQDEVSHTLRASMDLLLGEPGTEERGFEESRRRYFPLCLPARSEGRRGTSHVFRCLQMPSDAFKLEVFKWSSVQAFNFSPTRSSLIHPYST